MANNETPVWTIEGQVEDYRQLPSGAFGMGVVITFRLANGNTGTVFVPTEQYTEANVKKAVSERAATMAAIAGLTG